MSIVILGIMILLWIFFYYIYYPIHGENNTFFLLYIIICICFYGIYRLIEILKGSHITPTIMSLIGVFLFQLLLLSSIFFWFSWFSAGGGVVLFFEIVFFLTCVWVFWSIMLAVGKNIIHKMIWDDTFSTGIYILLSVTVWFWIYMLWVYIAAYFGAYSLWFVIWWAVLLGGISWKYFIDIFREFRTPLTWKNTSSEMSRYIDTFHYGMITFLLAINCISVFRPYPIGWDDLWVYMNFPKLLSQAGELLPLWQMYLWQLYTGIGFLAWSQTLAFYLNSFSWVLAWLALYIWIKEITKKFETPWDMWLMSVMILLMMPMTVFQLAKDMKLDYWLLFVSLASLFSMYYVVFFSHTWSRKKYLSFLWIIWVLMWLAFSIKVTSLLLILGVLATLTYKRYSVWWVISFFGLFFAVFSTVWLWGMMNVVVPTESTWVWIFSGIACLIAIIIWIYSVVRQWDGWWWFTRFTSEVCVLLLGFSLAIVPWVVKNYWEIPAGSPVELSKLISWYSAGFSPDYSRIYSPNELEEKKSQEISRMELTGNTKNEDFWRYFGYEWGINNYLKLPWNLTFQVHQKGEFTDITYIFFALLPAVLLFLPYRKTFYTYPIMWALICTLLYFIPSPISTTITNMFSQIHLPWGYGYIFLFFFLPFVYFHWALDREKRINKIFLGNFVFTTVYVFLWDISAFGIVWYGIVMYSVFLIMITLGIIALQGYEKNTRSIGNMLILLCIWLYVGFSALPHGMNNLQAAGFPEYKLWWETEEVAIIKNHPEYFSILYALNLNTQAQQSLIENAKNTLENQFKNMQEGQHILPVIDAIQTSQELRQIMNYLTKVQLPDNVSHAIEDLRQEVYEAVIYPSVEERSEKIIFRAGTFLKYFISQNDTRLFEDNLLLKFENYIYDENIQTTYTRFITLWVNYLLVDLNAATIDKWEQKHLTERYEHMLEFFTYDDVALIETDSLCLSTALSSFKKDEDMEKYLKIAGVNYGTSKERKEKKLACAQEIVSLLKSDTTYDFLSPIAAYIEQNQILLTDIETLIPLILSSTRNGNKAVFELK